MNKIKKMIKCKLCMNIHFSHCVPMERVHHISLSCELNRKSTKNFYNLGIYSED